MLTNLVSNFNSNNIISISVNSGIFLLICLGSYLLIRKLKFDAQGYKLLFVLYTCFWIPLMLLRAYSGTMQNQSLKAPQYLWIVAASYGAVGIFARPLSDFFSFKTKSRKSIIYFALGIQVVTFVPIIIHPCTATNVIQAIGVGIGASCIGTYELMFFEQYGKSKSFLTVSVLSIPPLLADFISAPIQSIVVSFTDITTNDRPSYDVNVMKWLWAIGLFFVLISFVFDALYKREQKLLFKRTQWKRSD